MRLCPNLVRLNLDCKGTEYSEPLFQYLTPQIAPQLKNFTLLIDRDTFTNLLPLLVDFFAASMGLRTLHLASHGWRPQSNVVDLVASRIRQLPSLQQVTVPTVDLLRCAFGTVGNSPISHLDIASILDPNDLEYIEQEFAATLERLNLYGLRVPKHAQPLFFPVLHSLTICPYEVFGATPLTSLFSPNTPLELLTIQGMSEDLL